MRSLKQAVSGQRSAVSIAAVCCVLLASLLMGCQTKPAPSVTGTVRTPDVIYGNPGRK